MMGSPARDHSNAENPRPFLSSQISLIDLRTHEAAFNPSASAKGLGLSAAEIADETYASKLLETRTNSSRVSSIKLSSAQIRFCCSSGGRSNSSSFSVVQLI